MSNNIKKVVKSNTVVTAPNPKRLGAFVIDQLFLYLVFALYFAAFGVTPDKPAPAVVFFGAVLITLAYRIFFPVFVSRGINSGQTLGKRAMGIKTISADGTDVSVKALIIRSMFMLVIEGLELLGVLYLLNAVALLGFPQITFITYMNVVIGIASIALMIVKPSHQLLHDYVASTVVILVKQ